LKSGLGSDREERREQIEPKYLKWNEKKKEKKEKERVMLHIIPLSFFYHPKFNMTLKITIEFMIDYY
jgi:hypothetical protein